MSTTAQLARPTTPAPTPMSPQIPAWIARAEGALVASRRADLQQVHVTGSGHGVRLTGVVPGFFAKQLAQETVMHAGVRVTANDVVVRLPPR